MLTLDRPTGATPVLYELLAVCVDSGRQFVEASGLSEHREVTTLLQRCAVQRSVSAAILRRLIGEVGAPDRRTEHSLAELSLYEPCDLALLSAHERHDDASVIAICLVHASNTLECYRRALAILEPGSVRTSTHRQLREVETTVRELEALQEHFISQGISQGGTR